MCVFVCKITYLWIDLKFDLVSAYFITREKIQYIRYKDI